MDSVGRDSDHQREEWDREKKIIKNIKKNSTQRADINSTTISTALAGDQQESRWSVSVELTRHDVMCVWGE